MQRTTLGWNFASDKANEEIAEVARSFPQLTLLEIRNTTYSAADFAALAAFRGLEEFRSWGKETSDDALRGLLAVKTLKTVTLSSGSSAITDTGLGHLAEHKGLIEIVCRDAVAITDDGLLKLAAVKSLQRLVITGSPKLTPAGFAAFQKARPDVKVE